VIALFFLGVTLALLVLETSPRPAWLVVYAILFGLGFGARGPIITSMAADLFGGRNFGAIYGLMNSGNGFGSAVGPWFGGVVHDVSGSYRAAFLASVAFSVLGAACFWLARRRAA
jgi:MFS family permease